MVFLVRRTGVENFEKKKEIEEKHWKMKRKKTEERKESQSQITAINIFGFTFYIKNYILLENIVWKKAVYTIAFYLQFLCIARYMSRSNDTPKLNLDKYTNYNVIEICIKRLSTMK